MLIIKENLHFVKEHIHKKMSRPKFNYTVKTQIIKYICMSIQFYLSFFILEEMDLLEV